MIAQTIPWREARSVTVRAWLQSGVILAPEWPNTLDGVLAAVEHRERLGDRYGHGVDHHRPSIPVTVAKGRHGFGCGGQWWFHASCARPIGAAGVDVRWWHKRFDTDAAMARGTAVPNQVMAGSVGRHRSWRMPETVTVCAGLEWRAVGDPDRIRSMCNAVTQLGRKRSQGEGLVVRWEVAESGDPDPEWAVWWDGMIARPIPARCRDALGVPHADTVRAAIRPPYWRPPQTTREGGGFGRDWREVIAPWTTRSTL